MTFYEYKYGALPEPHFWRVPDTLRYMGVQIANRIVTIFHIETKGGGDPRLLPYSFLEDESVELSLDAYKYFSQERMIGGKKYGGICTNAIDGRIYAPELRVVLEVEASSSLRDGTLKPTHEVLTDFRVTPAYQYDVFLEHPVSVTNRATVAQRVKTGTYNAFGTANTVRTYDTHGTDHRGFRQDERDWVKKKNGGGN